MPPQSPFSGIAVFYKVVAGKHIFKDFKNDLSSTSGLRAGASGSLVLLFLLYSNSDPSGRRQQEKRFLGCGRLPGLDVYICFVNGTAIGLVFLKNI